MKSLADEGKTMGIEQTVTEFFGAIENGDIEALDVIYDANVRVWHSFSGTTRPKDAGIEMLRQVCEAGSVKYELHEQHIIGDRCIRRHDVHFTSKTGESLTIPVAVFITVGDGRITAIDEYVDSAQSGQVLNLDH